MIILFSRQNGKCHIKKKVLVQLTGIIFGQDIRNFFGAKPKNGQAEKTSPVMTKKRPKRVVLSSDSEDEVKETKAKVSKKPPPKRSAKSHALSDSGKSYTYIAFCNSLLQFPSFHYTDDDFTSKPVKKEEKKPVLKEVDPNDFFGQSASRPKASKGISSLQFSVP